jgi:hypothetical protein
MQWQDGHIVCDWWLATGIRPVRSPWILIIATIDTSATKMLK